MGRRNVRNAWRLWWSRVVGLTATTPRAAVSGLCHVRLGGVARGGRRVWVGDGSGPTFWCVLISLQLEKVDV